MKKLYLISSHLKNGSINNDSGSLSEYTELGWELYSSGLFVKEMIFNKEITFDDVIMTHYDRMFMYSGLGINVVQYDENYINNFDGQVIDLTKNIMSILEKYNFKELTEIQKKCLSYHNANLSFKPTKNFACFVIRLRSWVEGRGGPINFWLEKIKQAHEEGLDVYCVGKDSEKIIPSYAKNVTLEDYVGLISHDLCVESSGPSSGCMLLNHAFGKSKTNIFFFSDDSSLIDKGNGVGHLLIFGIQGNLNKEKTNYYKLT